MQKKKKRVVRLRLRACLGHGCELKIKSRYPGLCKNCKRTINAKAGDDEEYIVHL